MKMHGKKIEGPNTEIIVIPRGGDVSDIVFHAQAVLDMGPFEKLCPSPQPPQRILKGGKVDKNFEDPGYKTQLEHYGEKRIAYMVIQSLKATEGLEWETIKEGDHNTWLNLEKELKASGFSHVEIQRIMNGVFAANCLSEARVEEARKSFLLGMAEAPNGFSGRPTEPNSTPSGVPASASV